MSTRPFYKRRGFAVGAVVVAIPGLALAWYLLSPLFLNRTVVEDFPEAAVVGATGDGAVAVATGRIEGADAFHQGTGTATIYELPDGSLTLRLEDLDVTNGPDLHVIVTPVAAPEGRDDVHAAGSVDLGSLKGNRGSQNYEIPPGFVIGDELSVVIYCAPFHVIFATAALA